MKVLVKFATSSIKWSIFEAGSMVWGNLAGSKGELSRCGMDC